MSLVWIAQYEEKMLKKYFPKPCQTSADMFPNPRGLDDKPPSPLPAHRALLIWMLCLTPAPNNVKEYLILVYFKLLKWYFPSEKLKRIGSKISKPKVYPEFLLFPGSVTLNTCAAPLFMAAVFLLYFALMSLSSPLDLELCLHSDMDVLPHSYLWEQV